MKPNVRDFETSVHDDDKQCMYKMHIVNVIL